MSHPYNASKTPKGHILLRGFPKTLRLEFKAACKARGTNMTHVLKRMSLDYVNSYKREQRIIENEDS